MVWPRWAYAGVSKFRAQRENENAPSSELGAFPWKGGEYVLPMQPIRLKWKTGRQVEIPTEIVIYLLFRALNHWHF